MSESRGLYATATVISSPSTEELSQDQGDRASLDAADSGRGSWTSCSSGSHDNIQTIQHQRSWETLPFGHTHFDYSGDPAGLWASSSHMDQIMFSDHSTKYNRQNQSRESLEQAQSRASWASSTGYWGEDSEGDTGTIKRRGGKDVSAEAEGSSIASGTPEETRPVPAPAHVAATSSTAKGLTGKLIGELCYVWVVAIIYLISKSKITGLWFVLSHPLLYRPAKFMVCSRFWNELVVKSPGSEVRYI